MISDGYGELPVRPIFAMNVSEAELAPVLKANFMQPVIQVTNNMLVVDTGGERILVDTGFGEKLGPSFGSCEATRYTRSTASLWKWNRKDGLPVSCGMSLMRRKCLEIRAMRRGRKVGVLAIITTFAFAPAAAAQAPSPSKRTVYYRHVSGRLHHSYIRSLGRRGGRVVDARRAHGLWRGYGTGFVRLVGDPDSGLGFYPLPEKYRIGAWRYRLTHRLPYWQNPVLFAIAADAARYNYWIPGNRDYVYGVFNPYDGVGTPFFGGYYGLARDDD